MLLCQLFAALRNVLATKQVQDGQFGIHASSMQSLARLLSAAVCGLHNNTDSARYQLFIAGM